jgi:hypothetical protein
VYQEPVEQLKQSLAVKLSESIGIENNATLATALLALKCGGMIHPFEVLGRTSIADASWDAPQERLQQQRWRRSGLGRNIRSRIGNLDRLWRCSSRTRIRRS